MNTNNSTLIISDMEHNNEIKQNIINNFLNPFYKFTTVNLKKTVIGDIMKRSWFPVDYGERTNTLYFYLGNDTTISVDVIWNEQDNKYILNGFK